MLHTNLKGQIRSFSLGHIKHISRCLVAETTIGQHFDLRFLHLTKHCSPVSTSQTWSDHHDPACDLVKENKSFNGVDQVFRDVNFALLSQASNS